VWIGCVVPEIQCYIGYRYGTMFTVIFLFGKSSFAAACCDVIVVMVIFWVDQRYHGGLQVVTDHP